MEKRNYRPVRGRSERPEKSERFYEERDKESKDMIFGLRPVQEALKSGKDIDRILLQRDLKNPMIQELINEAREREIAVLQVPVEKLNRITRKNHQGVVCYLAAVSYAKIENVIAGVFEKGEPPLILILDRITDVRNFGAISRTAECAGVHAIVVPERGSAQINSDAVKTSAGALSYIPVCREANLKHTIDYLKESGLQIVSCSEKAGDWVYKADMRGPTAIIMGSEEDGVSAEYLKRSDKMVKIPMAGEISSLNVSVASGIIIYEAIRQRLGQG